MAFLIKRGIELSDESPRDDKVDQTSSPVICHHIDANRDQELNLALSQYNLNYVFDKPDERDYKFSSTLLKDIDPHSLPSSIDLRSQWGDILDQGSLGSCVSNSVAYQLRFLLKKNAGKDLNLSRLYVYYNGRALSKYPITEDTGLTMRNGFQSVTAHGAVDEKLWPYVVSQFAKRAPDSVYAIGSKNKNLVYYAVTQDLNQIKKCLKDGYAISFGIALFSSFMSTNVARSGQVPVPNESTEQRVGGHAMTIVGYQDSTSRFIVANSWGKSWGDSGYCYIPFSFILNKKLTGDLWTPRSFTIDNETPVPTPSPITPKPSPTIPSKWTAPNVQYKKGDLVTYLGGTYVCNISHKSITVWTPTAVPVIWSRV